MKHSSILVSVLLSVCGLVPAMGQSLPAQLPITNTLSALSTNIINLEIDCSQTSALALQIDFKLASPGPSNVTFTIEWGINRTNWMALFSAPVAANGTTITSWGTNVNVGGIPRLRLSTVSNVNTSAVQTLGVFVNPKKGL